VNPASPKLPFVRDGSLPVYAQIADFLKARIAQGEFIPGQKLPGTKLLAKELGVNHLTVRHALHKLEEEGIVATESARGTFVISQHSTHLQIALVLPNLYESSSQLSGGAQDEMRETKSTVDIFHYNEDTGLECSYLNRLVAEGYDGAIVFPSLQPVTLKPLLKMVIDGFPLVFIDRAPSVPCWTASVENLRGGYLATEHLIARGSRRIACGVSELSADRQAGCLRALGDHGLPVDYSLMRKFARADDEVEDWVDACLALPEPPDGFFFGNDFQAMRGLRQLLLRGRRVPADARVIGFDDLSLCTLSLPALSTIRQDFTALGRTAAALLREQVRLPREKRFCERHASVPVHLIVRDSS